MLRGGNIPHWHCRLPRQWQFLRPAAAARNTQLADGRSLGEACRSLGEALEKPVLSAAALDLTMSSVCSTGVISPSSQRPAVLSCRGRCVRRCVRVSGDGGPAKEMYINWLLRPLSIHCPEDEDEKLLTTNCHPENRYVNVMYVDISDSRLGADWVLLMGYSHI